MRLFMHLSEAARVTASNRGIQVLPHIEACAMPSHPRLPVSDMTRVAPQIG